MNALPDEAFIFPDPVFTGNVDGGPLPPAAVTSGWVAASQSIALHVNGTSSSFVVLMQDSLEINPSNQSQYEWFDLSVQFAFEDTIQTGTYAVNLHSGYGIDVYDMDPSINDPENPNKTCLKALGFLGTVTFNSMSGLTGNEGGSFDLSGGPVYLYHPSDVPIYGDITDQVEEAWGVPACPE